ncbi:hypothetical protein IQ07DRAFT_184458 [Pyrenochaeta sp. DS3sAY3a]|nr:hypothetical protein IQ07DRAFT_184458 [Pyrenochaeta sp. DS3sAY3a]
MAMSLKDVPPPRAQGPQTCSLQPYELACTLNRTPRSPDSTSYTTNTIKHPTLEPSRTYRRVKPTTILILQPTTRYQQPRIAPRSKPHYPPATFHPCFEIAARYIAVQDLNSSTRIFLSLEEHSRPLHGDHRILFSKTYTCPAALRIPPYTREKNLLLQCGTLQTTHLHAQLLSAQSILRPTHAQRRLLAKFQSCLLLRSYRSPIPDSPLPKAEYQMDMVGRELPCRIREFALPKSCFSYFLPIAVAVRLLLSSPRPRSYCRCSRHSYYHR